MRLTVSESLYDNGLEFICDTKKPLKACELLVHEFPELKRRIFLTEKTLQPYLVFISNGHLLRSKDLMNTKLEIEEMTIASAIAGG